jgi:hypothetical protein
MDESSATDSVPVRAPAELDLMAELAGPKPELAGRVERELFTSESDKHVRSGETNA